MPFNDKLGLHYPLNIITALAKEPQVHKRRHLALLPGRKLIQARIFILAALKIYPHP